MRITNAMMFDGSKLDYHNSMQGIYKANKDLSSGIKIQNNYEDSIIYDNTMRLDYNLITLTQNYKTADKAQEFANNSDKSLTLMYDTLSKVKEKMIRASNSGVNSITSMQAIANDLKGLRQDLLNMVNSSVGGQYLFSGSATDKKPVDMDGDYHGNNITMDALVSSQTKLPFNVPGDKLLMGKDNDYTKVVKTNVALKNQIREPHEQEQFINENSTIKELVGNFEGNTTFYLQGKRPNGDTFRSKITAEPTTKMQDILDQIGQAYGNNGTNEIVRVSMNQSGQIVIEDIKRGSSNLDFYLLGATDTTAAAGQAGMSDVNNVRDLEGNANIKLTHFIKGGRDGIDGNEIVLDDAKFLKKDNNKIYSANSQVVKATGSFATAETKLSEVAGANLNGEVFTIKGANVDGTPVEVSIILNDPASSFRINGQDFIIYDKMGQPTSANDMTYQQLTDVVAMTLSISNDSRPAIPNDPDEYFAAVKNSRRELDVSLDYRGRIMIKDNFNAHSRMELAIFNKDTGDWRKTSGNVLDFSTNNAITVDEPHVDLFKDIDNMIAAVTDMVVESDANSNIPRSAGIESLIKRLDHVMNHVTKVHTEIGSLSNALKVSAERSEFMALNVKQLQSSFIDTDLGEATLMLNQYMMTYQGILQITAKINQLSLVNYI